ncbi:MAG: DPP IV N-terminal domain-containing protein [Candidatus Eisenbacteria bacterium]|uniref:DPP IV N-terminal domain-containing protein n=1 Tax=Eiseniibacteriota bacterium TaxID=2212470 RepID=A0A948S0L6_UNCEI|nr:DPP IV N-terminal domain-containing protein [Candidatus Eisenbacteria bacterium]
MKIRYLLYVFLILFLGCSDDKSTTPTPSDTTPPAAVQDLATAPSIEDQVTLYWTAPGDDGSSGQAAAYEIRYMTTPITEALWDSATIAPSPPEPAISGQFQHVEISGFDWGEWFFALKTADEVPNWSELSNIASATIGDTTAPGAISDLFVSSFDESSVSLSWTASGDDDYSGRAAGYDLRYALTTITDESWEAATQVQSVPAPDSSGVDEAFTVTNLDAGQEHFFAIKSLDDRSNESDLSNVVSATPILDEIPPEQVSDLEVTSANGHNAILTWTAPGNNGSEGIAAEYDLRYSLAEITDESWAEAIQVQDVPAPETPGSEESFTIGDLELETTYFFALKTVDGAPNWSELSNVVSATTVANVQLTFSSRTGWAASPAWSPDGDKLVYVTDHGTNRTRQLSMISATGGQSVRLTDDPLRSSHSPSWAPGGNQLTFITYGSDLTNAIWIMDPVFGSDYSLLVSHGEDNNIQSYSFSADGSQIVYSVQVSFSPDYLKETYIIPFSGGSPELLLSDDWPTYGVSWSPVGDQIVFGADYDIWVISANGGTPLQLTTDPARDMFPAWSPDGSQIVFSSNRSENWDIWVMSATGENLSQLTFNLADQSYPSWSPDGRAISYSSTSSEGISDIWVLYLE